MFLCKNLFFCYYRWMKHPGDMKVCEKSWLIYYIIAHIYVYSTIFKLRCPVWFLTFYMQYIFFSKNLNSKSYHSIFKNNIFLEIKVHIEYYYCHKLYIKIKSNIMFNHLPKFKPVWIWCDLKGWPWAQIISTYFFFQIHWA